MPSPFPGMDPFIEAATKEPPFRAGFLDARRARLYQGTNLVELDLLVQGSRIPFRSAIPPCDYLATVTPVSSWPRASAYPFSVRSKLPRIRVPLHEGDPAIEFDLGAVFAKVYDAAKYGRSIDYSILPAFLRPEDQLWAKERLSASTSSPP